MIRNLKDVVEEVIRKDRRVVYGQACLWWDDISKVSSTPPDKNGVTIPACPHCGSVLYQMDNPEMWWAGVDAFEASGHAGYHDFVAWLQGRCFPSQKAALKAFKDELGLEVKL